LYLDKASFKVLVIITGKGPLYEHFRLKIHDQNQKMSHIRILQAWLDPEDYPVLLGSSDLGISLHLSSSGRDLPMKIVDMFGAGLPVCAFSFPCLSELVQDQVNGLLFSNSNELSQNLIKIFDKSEAHSEKLKKLYEGVRDCSTYKMRWSENWNQVALPVLLN
jgi:beta-1,4-mannosyltransferase